MKNRSSIYFFMRSSHFYRGFLSVCMGLALVITPLILLEGCLSNLKSINELKGRSPHVAYKTAQRAMTYHRYEEAIKYYEFITSTYPFSPYAEQAHLDSIYAYYRNNELELGITAATRYIHLYPRAPHVDYAYYMKGLLSFLSGITWSQRYLPLELAQHDLSGMKEGFSAFNELVHLFPQSRYTPDAYRRLIYIRNVLAKYELSVAQYYYAHQADIAAANRATVIVKHFQGSPYVMPALKLMVKAYRRIGDHLLADKTQKLIDYNRQWAHAHP